MTWRKRALDSVRDYEEKGPGTGLAAETALKIIESKTPRLRYIIGQQAKLFTRLRRLLPESMFKQGTRITFYLDKEK